VNNIFDDIFFCNFPAAVSQKKHKFKVHPEHLMFTLA